MENKLAKELKDKHSLFIGKVDSESGIINFLNYNTEFAADNFDLYHDDYDSAPKGYSLKEISILVKDLFDKDEIIVILNVVEHKVFITFSNKIQEAINILEREK